MLAVAAGSVDMKEICATGRQASNLNNTALKTMRDANKSPPGFPGYDKGVLIYQYDFHKDINYDPFMVEALQRSRGMAYSLIRRS